MRQPSLIDVSNSLSLSLLLNVKNINKMYFIDFFLKRGREIETLMNLNWFGSVDRASACRLKGPRFDPGQGHVHWLRAHPR